ncbi:MAG: hypothetical protein KGN01_07345 [Patescibacteria group bacterium]|nr:hypothetical protein [Patescibacteria group bacterium]
MKKVKKNRKVRIKTPQWICIGCKKKGKGTNLKTFPHKTSCLYYRAPGDRILTSSAKGKGRLFQQEVRDLFLKLGNLPAGEIESRGMGQAGEDVIFNSREAQKLFPFYVEVKRSSTGFRPDSIFEDLRSKATAKEKTPLLFHRQDRKDPLVTMDLSTFVDFLTNTLPDNVREG